MEGLDATMFPFYSRIRNLDIPAYSDCFERSSPVTLKMNPKWNTSLIELTVGLPCLLMWSRPSDVLSNLRICRLSGGSGDLLDSARVDCSTLRALWISEASLGHSLLQSLSKCARLKTLDLSCMSVDPTFDAHPLFRNSARNRF